MIRQSSFDIRSIMDEGKILVVNLSKGLIGEDNASIDVGLVSPSLQVDEADILFHD